jgi:hypothetical protein
MKYIFCLIWLFVTIATDISSQKKSGSDNYDAKNSMKIEGIYGLSSFVKPHEDIITHYSSMIIKFDTSNNFSTHLGNSIGGKIYLLDSNKVELKNCRTTLVACYTTTRSGFKYSSDIFMDSLLKCDKYKVSGSEIKFFRDSTFRLSIKPYYELLGFKKKENMESSYAEAIKVYNIDEIDDYVLVNSEEEMINLGIEINYKYLDFEYSSLVVIQNKSLQSNDDESLQKLANFIMPKTNQEFYPVSYAKAFIEPRKGKMVLDIINTYVNWKGKDGGRRGKYSGIIIDKINAKKLKVNIAYTE